MSRQTKMLIAASIVSLLAIGLFLTMSGSSSPVSRAGASHSTVEPPTAAEPSAQAPTRNAASADPEEFARPDEADPVAEMNVDSDVQQDQRRQTKRRQDSRRARTDASAQDEPERDSESTQDGKPKFSGARFAPQP